MYLHKWCLCNVSGKPVSIYIGASTHNKHQEIHARMVCMYVLSTDYVNMYCVRFS